MIIVCGKVHQINCDYILQSCINNGCNEKYLRKDVIHHDQICLYKVIQCTYCQTHVLTMNKENHEVECLNEEVTCIYYEIGCDKKFCRKYIQSHDQIHQANHMKLIYKNLVDCKQELLTTNNKVTVLSQENITMKQESITIIQENVTIKQDIITMKVENVTLKEEGCSLTKEVDKLKIKSNKEVAQLKQEIKTMTTEFQEFKKKNIIIKENINVSSSEVADEKQIQIKEVNNIDQLKEKFRASPLSQKVSLLNNDKVLKVNYNSKSVRFLDVMQNLSECYKNNQFDFIFNHYNLVDQRNIMKELLSQLPYHLFQVQDMFYHYSRLGFPLDLNNMKNFEVTIPNNFKVKIVNNEITVELTNAYDTSICLYIGKYCTVLQHQQKFNFQQLNGCNDWEFEFAHGYALLRIQFEICFN